jgi:hypothetical protein
MRVTMSLNDLEPTFLRSNFSTPDERAADERVALHLMQVKNGGGGGASAPIPQQQQQQQKQQRPQTVPSSFAFGSAPHDPGNVVADGHHRPIPGGLLSSTASGSIFDDARITTYSIFALQLLILLLLVWSLSRKK